MASLQPISATVGAAVVLGGALAVPQVAFGQTAASRPAGTAENVDAVRTELAQARAQIADQQRQLAEQQRRLDLLEQRLAGLAQATQQIREEVALAPPVPAAPLSAGPNVRVGEAPRDSDRPPTVAVLDQQGTVVLRKGELVGELGVDYSRSDRNRVLFRGEPLAQVILLGVFDINESRQDIVTGSATLRYGLFDRMDVGVRVPFLYRADSLIATPIRTDPETQAAATIDSSTEGTGIGDIEVTARYQLNNGGRNTPFLIANLQASIPTGRDPYSVRRVDGNALESATGAGFWSVTPGLTAILPSEPAVLFGTIGYTFNFARDVNTAIYSLQVDRVNPGDQISVSAGIGLGLNDRTSMNLGYSHGWVFGTQSTVREISNTGGLGPPIQTTTRDLQVGRLLLGVSHRFSPSLQINWSVEVGATQDAPNLRTSLRIPIQF